MNFYVCWFSNSAILSFFSLTILLYFSFYFSSSFFKSSNFSLSSSLSLSISAFSSLNYVIFCCNKLFYSSDSSSFIYFCFNWSWNSVSFFTTVFSISFILISLLSTSVLIMYNYSVITASLFSISLIFYSFLFSSLCKRVILSFLLSNSFSSSLTALSFLLHFS